MDTKVLVAVSEDGGFQIVNLASSMDEAREMAQNYVRYGPDNNWLAPDHFELHDRGGLGGFTRISNVVI